MQASNRSFWKKIDSLPTWLRFTLKTLIFLIVLLLVIFPNPKRLLRQLGNYRHPERLIQTDFAGMAQIQAELDSLMRIHPDKSELELIQHYVYQKIPYRFDWELWSNSDYWPTAAETWSRQSEDCDGQAILAVSIMRARGYSAARLGINMLHIWVEVDSIGMMGAMAEKSIEKRDGRTIIHLPSRQLLISTTAFMIKNFPALRIVLLLLTILILAIYPSKHHLYFLSTLVITLLGFILLKEWSLDFSPPENPEIDLHFMGGMLLIILAIVGALGNSKIIRLIRQIRSTTR